jgi:hypothetical protein
MTYELSARDIEYVDKVVASFPPLSFDQINRLGTLLNMAREPKAEKKPSLVERLAEGISNG